MRCECSGANAAILDGSTIAARSIVERTAEARQVFVLFMCIMIDRQVVCSCCNLDSRRIAVLANASDVLFRFSSMELSSDSIENFFVRKISVHVTTCRRNLALLPFWVSRRIPPSIEKQNPAAEFESRSHAIWTNEIGPTGNQYENPCQLPNHKAPRSTHQG